MVKVKIVYQYSYKILDIIMKMLPNITPIITLIFSLQVAPRTLKCRLDTVLY